MSGAVKCGISGLVLLLSATGCTVKEDREHCLCLLHLDFPQTDSVDTKGSVFALTDAAGIFLADTLDSVSEYEVYVPKKRFLGNLWKGTGDCCISEGGLFIPYGDACPEVFMYSFEADCNMEFCTEEIVFRKNFCRILVRTAGVSSYPYDVAVRGNIDGYDVRGYPRKGGFFCIAHRTDEEFYRLTVPRQTDASLMMDIVDDSNVFRSFAIGEYMATAGYDWNAPDLADVEILLDYDVAEIIVKVESWWNEYEYDIVL